MENTVSTRSKGSLIEQVLIKGDLSSLTPEQRSNYYTQVCSSVGLNHLTKPFEYITLNGKLTLYALRACTDQLRSVYKVSVEELTETERDGVFIVTAKVKNGEGRTDMAKGAVNIKGLQGESLANALMKAETKAKRRATLSLCGLGMLDETEVETIPNTSKIRDITPSATDHLKPKSPFQNAAGRNLFCKNVKSSFQNAETHAQLTQLQELNKARFDEMGISGAEADHLGLEDLRQAFQVRWNGLAIATRETPEEDPAFDEEEIARENNIAAGLEMPPEFLRIHGDR